MGGILSTFELKQKIIGSLDPEQLLLFRKIEDNYNISDIQPYLFTGYFSSSTMDIEVNNILWLAFSLEIGWISANTLDDNSSLIASLHSASTIFSINNKSISSYYDGASEVNKMQLNNCITKNIYFASLACNLNPLIKFIGYKLTIKL